MPLSPGQILNIRYRVVKLLGQGGFGAVYKVWDINLERPRALKENLEVSPGAQRQFKREAQILTDLAHPNLPRVTDCFSIAGQGQYLVMDFIEGEDLEQILERTGRPVPEAQLLEWIEQVCSALEYLHAQNPPIIHRDIKPANIKITPEGKAMLVDFGIAKAFDPTMKTTVGARAVTPGYSPLEQYGHEITDQRSDVYALGATVYHVLTGVLPPAAISITTGSAAPPKPARLVNPSISPRVSAAIEKAMQLRRPERTGSVAQFKAELITPPSAPVATQAPHTSLATQIATPPLPQQASQQSSQLTKPSPGLPQWALWLGGIVLAAILLIYLVASISGRDNPSRATATVLAEAVATTTPTRSLGSGIDLPTTPPTTVVTPSPPISIPTEVIALPFSQPVPRPQSPIRPDNADKVQLLSLWGRGKPGQMSWLADSTTFGIVSSAGVYIYNAKTLQQIRWIHADLEADRTIFSPDGTLLAYATDDGPVEIWRLADWQLVHTLGSPDRHVSHAAFSPDGKVLALTTWENKSVPYQVELWSIESETLIFSMGKNPKSFNTLAFSPDGEKLASGSEDEFIYLWRVSDRQLLYSMRAHTEGVTDIAFSPDGETLASAGSKGGVSLWRTSDGKNINDLEVDAHSHGFTSGLAFTNDGSQLIVVGYRADDDFDAYVWQVSSGELVKTLEAHNSKGKRDSKLGLSLSPDGSVLAITLDDGTVQFYQVPEFEPLRTLAGDVEFIKAVDFSPDSTLLAAGGYDGAVRIWNLDDGILLHKLVADHDIDNLKFSHDGKMLACSAYPYIFVWSTTSGALLLKIDDGFSKNLAFSPDDRLIASAHSWSGVDYVALFNTNDGSLINSLKGHGKDIAEVAFSPDGTILASASEDGTIKLWRVADSSLLHTLDNEGDAVRSIAFSPDGRLLVSASINRELRIWRVSSGAMVKILDATTKKVVFSPDGSMFVAVGYLSEGIRFWNASTWDLLATLDIQPDNIAFSPDGYFLASVDEDGTIRIWGVIE